MAFTALGQRVTGSVCLRKSKQLSKLGGQKARIRQIASQAPSRQARKIRPSLVSGFKFQSWLEPRQAAIQRIGVLEFRVNLRLELDVRGRAARLRAARSFALAQTRLTSHSFRRCVGMSRAVTNPFD